MFDVRRAYFYDEEKRDTFVELPDDVPVEFRTTHVGKLREALFGTRPAAASWRDEMRKELVSCSLTVGTVSRRCFHNELCSVAGTVHGGGIFVAGPRQDIAKMWATLKKRWETRDQMIGPKPDDQKKLCSLNRTLRWCKDGFVFAANLSHGREVVDELGLSKSKPVSSPATADGVARCQDDEFKSLNGEEKRLYQRIVAKLNYLAHDRAGPEVCNFLSSKCCLVAEHWRHESGEASWTILEESTSCLAGFPFA